MTEAVDEEGTSFHHPLLGKQSTKPLKQSGCIAHAAVRKKLSTQCKPWPRGVGLIELCLQQENCKNWGRCDVGVIETIISHHLLDILSLLLICCQCVNFVLWFLTHVSYLFVSFHAPMHPEFIYAKFFCFEITSNVIGKF